MTMRLPVLGARVAAGRDARGIGNAPLPPDHRAHGAAARCDRTLVCVVGADPAWTQLFALRLVASASAAGCPIAVLRGPGAPAESGDGSALWRRAGAADVFAVAEAEPIDAALSALRGSAPRTLVLATGFALAARLHASVAVHLAADPRDLPRARTRARLAADAELLLVGPSLGVAERLGERLAGVFDPSRCAPPGQAAELGP